MNLTFRDLLGLSFVITDNTEDFNAYQGPKLAYSSTHFVEGIRMAPAGLLHESGIRNQLPEIKWKDDLPRCFPVKDPEVTLSYDLFSAIFFFVSRYEEYLDHPKDVHGRFSARESLAGRHGFLEKPVVNLWTREIRDHLKAVYPALVFKEPSYRFLPTYDIDTSFSYAHKGILRTAAGSFRDLVNGKWENLNERWQVISGRSKDPFDTFDFILRKNQELGLDTISFFLVGDHGKNDPSNSFSSPTMKSVVSKMHSSGAVGLHPSYASADEPRRVKVEKDRLEYLLEGTVTKARQHFIRLSFPDTYEHYINAGIREDYSMGFADQPGFRAGIANPFRFFNLRTDQESELTIYPFVFMDVTLKNYLKLSIPASIALCASLTEQVKAVNGTLISVWHNESLCDMGEWQGWKNAYESIIQTASK
ncbi:MAG: hypothetical protein FJY10_07930 [Bacteroidetes bacterium]|nr:hypothetical protein [Bacteroidota bacterium]